MEGGEGKFRINRKSGQVTLKRKLEREDQNKEYVLIIEAQDSGKKTMQFLHFSFWTRILLGLVWIVG